MWLEIIIAVLSGIAGGVTLIGLAALLGVRLGGYFSPPLFMLGLAALLAVVAYHLALKPQFYVVISQDNKPLTNYSMPRIADSIYITEHADIQPELEFSDLVIQLEHSEEWKLCQHYPSQQLDICVNKKGWW
ncbi:hypothetical protein EZV61_11610 [Corallincola luteus]|uniref:Uncharacterized protein n=1 Tax=Corallincola luteus TaxID=1775177 RepID=A0ABY2ALB4_9GAMM|nr:hypothetical protein [Corallincola luteus]TCI02930.1 hypothetical protein EZV61_11610 [Corallincola luteus]